MGFSLDIQISAAAVFAQGLLSFFSPCVLPLIPLYIGYLSGGTARRGEDGRMYYKRSRVLVNTLFFVLGISSVSYTHLDVYKRQHVEYKASGEAVTGLGSLLKGLKL